MGTNCTLLLDDLVVFPYENDLLHNMITSGHRKVVWSFNLCNRYIDDLIICNNKKLWEYAKEINAFHLNVEQVISQTTLEITLRFKIYDLRSTLMVKFPLNRMTKVMISISIQSIFHSFQVIYHLVVHIVFTSLGS